MTPEELQQTTGAHQLFCGISTHDWSLDQFRQAAQFARAHGIDTLIVKVADGTNEWYNGNFPQIRQVILNEGVGCIPYMYSYGRTLNALAIECNMMQTYLQAYGIFCMDAEQEYNGDVAAAQYVCGRIQGQAGCFMVSTWADPSLQEWGDVIRALAPCTTVFMPQEYNSYLAGFWEEFAQDGATWLQPTVNLTQDFGANDPVAIAKNAHDQGHTGLSVWYYEPATQNTVLLDAIYAAFPKMLAAVPPPPNPNIIQAALDTWKSTAFLFGGTPLDYTTGIAQSWTARYVNEQINMPPPTTREFDSVDWNGNKITVQFFGTVRCEWDAQGQAHWYQTGV